MRSNQLSLNKLGGVGILSLTANPVAHRPPACEALEGRDTRTTQAPAGAKPKWRGVFERLDHWLWSLRQRDIEAYLAKATDVCDLEARLRALERNGFYPYY
jgi:hypothetical protein